MPITPRVLDVFLLWTWVFYILSGILFLWKSLPLNWARGSLTVGLLFHLSFFGVQWYLLGRVPLYHGPLVLATFLVGYSWLASQEARPVLVGGCLVLLLTLWMFQKKDPTIVLSTAHDSGWLALHIVATWFAFGCFGLATVLSGVYLWKKYGKGEEPEFLAKLDRRMYKLVALGCLFQALMLVAGMMWAKKLFGRYWNWDRVEVWALLVFLFYLLYLHGRVLLGWQGEAMAWMLWLGFFFLLISLFGLPYILPNRHLERPTESLHGRKNFPKSLQNSPFLLK